MGNANNPYGGDQTPIRSKDGELMRKNSLQNKQPTSQQTNKNPYAGQTNEGGG